MPLLLRRIHIVLIYFLCFFIPVYLFIITNYTVYC
jgi:hypothetical protein